MTRVAAIILLLLGAAAARGAEYCSLVVRVLSPDQKRVLEVPVSVRESNGRVVEKDTDSSDLRFCDLGIKPVTVTVGRHECNQVVVRGVPLFWEEEYLLAVTYDPEPCEKELPPPAVPVCQVLLRIADTSGGWISKASVQFPNSALARRDTDAAGRAFVTLKTGNRVEGTVRSDGYNTKQFSLSCAPGQVSQEELIKIERSAGR
jgi:hypothetical protein